MILGVPFHQNPRVESVCPRAVPRNKTELTVPFEEHKQFSERLMRGIEELIACSFQFLFMISFMRMEIQNMCQHFLLSVSHY